MRRILKIIIVLLIVGTVIAFFVFYKKQQNASPVTIPLKQVAEDFITFGTKIKNTPDTTTNTNNQGVPTIPAIYSPDKALNKLSQRNIVAISEYDTILPQDAIIDPKTKKKTIPPPIIESGIAYTERGTGFLFVRNSKNLGTEYQFTTTNAPKIGEAFIGGNAEYLILRYAEEDGASIDTYLGKVAESNRPQPLSGKFLTRNISNIAISPDHNGMLMIVPNGNTITGILQSFKTGIKRNLFQSSFSEWLPQWTNDNLITITTKPSSLVDGYVYGVDIQTGNMKKILGGVKGLTTLMNPQANLMLYGEAKGSLYILNTMNIQNKVKTSLNIKTLPEKCVWSTKEIYVAYCGVPNIMEPNSYPDTWYRGEVSFGDSLWKVNIKDLVFNQIINPEQTDGVGIDITNMIMTNDGKMLYFTNKKDNSLWSYTL